MRVTKLLCIDHLALLNFVGTRSSKYFHVRGTRGTLSTNTWLHNGSH